MKKLDPYFIIKLPNGKQLLYRCEVKLWVDMIDVVKYFKEEYDADIFIANITKREAKKYLRGKKI